MLDTGQLTGALQHCYSLLPARHNSKERCPVLLLTAFATSWAVQAVQAEQWKAERQDLELKAATWCQDQIQSVHKQAEQAVSAAESKCEIWCVVNLHMQPVAAP